MREWCRKNPDKLRIIRRRHYLKHRGEIRKRWTGYIAKLKAEVHDHYGNKCACCGETAKQFLTIDHVNNNGSAHRRQLQGNQFYMYKSIIDADYPSDYQILCMNCNWAKRYGICPHRKDDAATPRPDMADAPKTVNG